MGFHVSLDELNKAADKLGQEAGKLESQLDTAKNSVNKIITSEALTGKTGQAIYHQLNNVDAAIIVGLEDTTKLLASDLYSLISEFQSSVGESSATAVLDEDYLNQLKDNLNNFKNQHGEQEINISGIYSSISDLISLSGPTSTYDADSDTASQLLTNTIDKVTSFDSAGSELSSESMLTAIDSKVNQVSQVVDLPYSDSQYLSFVNDADFAKGINTVDKQIKEQEKLAKEEAEKEAKKEWAKQHPIEALLQFTTEETTNFFEWANQEVLGSNLLPTEKIEMSLALGFASKACETVGDLAIGAVQIINLEQEALLDLENKYVLHRETPQWIKDDLTGTCNNVQAVIGFAGDLIKRDPKAWKAVYKGIEDSASEVIHNIATGNNFEIGGYVFDVATLVGLAAVSKLKYAEEASNLAKLAEAGDVASTVGKVEDGVKVGKALSFEKLMSAEDAQKYVQWNKYAEAGISPSDRVRVLEISEKAPKVEYREGVSPDDILAMPKKNRPNPKRVYKPSYIEAHRQQFENGAIKFQKFTPEKGGFNNGAIGNPKDHVAFVMPKEVGETLIEISKGNPRILEDLLGLHPGDLGDSPVAIDIPAENLHNIRIPSGNEKSAFDSYWKPGGRTYPGDMPEAVVDEIPWGNYTFRQLGGH